ncbi:MAG: pirin family protein [Rhodospirillaceae bacterium]
MITVRDRNDRGHTKTGWLDSHHTFSFGAYHDPANMGFGALRVINDDRIIPGAGFPTHGHRDMEIISYVVSGAVEHKDSMGTGSIIRPGDVQRMSAGTGVTHSEFNPSKDEGARFLQVWITPEQAGLKPSYEQKNFSQRERTDTLRRVASQDGQNGAVKVHQDVSIYATMLTAGSEVTHTIARGRQIWVQVVQGCVNINDTELREGDGAAVTDETSITLSSQTGAEVLVFDLAA